MARTTRGRFVRLLIALSVLFAGIIWAAIGGDAISEEMESWGDLVFVPSPELTKIACLGYDNLVSDVFWLRTVRYVHNQQKGAKRFDMLKDMLDVVTRLDPYACDVYKRGGCWLYQDAESPVDGIGFMQKGLRLVPERKKNRWELAYHIGQCFRDVLYDEHDATRYFEMARKMPGAPPVLIVAVAAGYERQGMFDRAKELWKEARDTTADVNIANAAHQKIQDIETTRHTIDFLQHKVDTFTEQFGRVPQDLSELVRAGFLDAVSPPPLSGTYEIEPASGRVHYLYIPQDLAEQK